MQQWMEGLVVKTLITLLVLSLQALVPAAANDNTIWDDVRTGDSLVILRHALAPGTGDPENFDVNECATQRNLSKEGLQQAQRIGDLFKQHGLFDAKIFTSQWCRCIDTAIAMEMGGYRELPELNSFYEQPEKKPAQMKALRKWLQALDTDKPVILVTHQVVISALTAVYPTSGEAVIFKMLQDGSVEVQHRVATK